MITSSSFALVGRPKLTNFSVSRSSQPYSVGDQSNASSYSISGCKPTLWPATPIVRKKIQGAVQMHVKMPDPIFAGAADTLLFERFGLITQLTQHSLNAATYLRP